MGMRVALQDLAGPNIPTFLTYYPAVMLVAVVGGLGPGLVVTGISVLVVDYYFLPPYRQLALVELSDLVTLTFFALMGVLISVVCERLRVNLKKVAAYQAEQAAWESRAKLEAALASMSDALAIFDAEGRLIHANAALSRFHRFANAEKRPTAVEEFQQILEIQKPDGTPIEPEMWSVPRALRGDSETNIEYRLRRTDTGESWIGSYSFGPVRNAEGKIIACVLVARDITEQKAAEELLRKREHELSLIYENMHDVLFYLAVEPGEQFRFVTVNPSFLRVTGLDAGMVEGKLVQEVIPEPAIGMALEKYTEAIREKKTVLWTETTVYPRGEKHAEVLISPVFNTSGECTNLIGVLHDMTERRQAEKRIEQLNRVYSVLSDTNQTIVRVKDVQKMLDTACRIAVEKGGFRMAWVGKIDASGHMLKPYVSSGAIEGYLDRFQIDVNGEEYRHGPAARSIHSGQHAICNDILNDPGFHTWREAAVERGFRACGAFPLFLDKKVWGVLVLYAAELGFFSNDEIKLFDEMAMDISFALEVNEREKERVRAEEHVRQLNRVYSVLSDVNQTIVRVNDTQKMLEACCRIATEKGRFRMAWVGKADESGLVLIPYTWSGVVDGYLDGFQIDAGSAEYQDGPVGRSIQSGVHVICNDIASDPGFFTKREAEERGYRSCAAFPLHLEGKVWGALVLYASEPGFFDEDELRLLDEMAMDISFALEVNRNEEKRRRSEEELERRTALFEAQVDSSLDGVLVIDNTGKKILQNERFNRLMHIPQEIADDPSDGPQRRYVESLLRSPEQFQDKIEDLNAHPELISREELELLDGTVFERYSSPVQDKAGQHYGRIWTFRDITERRKQDENLRQSQKMEALGQLSGGIAHDFNNLLTVILGCAEFLGEEVKENNRLHRMAEMIVDAARRGADVTRRMLAFARRQSLQPTAIDVNGLLGGIESFLRRALTSEIELEMVARDLECVAIADRSQLENALLNLCVNARDAMPRGGKLIVEASKRTLDADYAALHPDVEPGEYVLIDVTDTGTGIGPENLSKVFDPFFTTKEAGKGTGLGLSMVYGFVKQSRGHVRIYSELGHGTSVKLYLPRAKEAAGVVQKRVPKIDELRGSETILLVEDDDAVREYATAQLKSLGYTVLEASNGKEALKQLEGHTEIDMLFTDIVMPGGMDGCELGRQARSLRSALAVLHCSGYAESAFARHGALDEDIEVLSKPYTRLEVAERIRKVLEKGKK